LLPGKDVFVSEPAGAALALFVEDTDAGAIGAEDAVSQVGGQFGFEGTAALAAEIAVRRGFGATEGADRQIQGAAAMGAFHIRLPHAQVRESE
jgi:hypothetical protein